eukprot:Gregarina_sp_Pseudo_9__1709@NODE_2159_length_1121_cov_37_178373_g1988_i0_p1_GENE_NODE_2159_length_1121_cov_37_178373_g1988_i0NODE_2159_length_1121_cov_37_178373_g1988_i0_p1_ORF_typecomplete_len215_score44_96EMP24_GP25L/PF01105_24/4_5e20CCB1/PF12046_8/0_0047_NODE_2159_length_1121_cov_37_178373_g1988_i024668
MLRALAAVVAALAISVSGVRVALLPLEEECIGVRAITQTEVILNYEGFPSDESRVKVTVDKKQTDVKTGNLMLDWEKSRTIPAWNHGRLNLTADLFNTHQTVFRICFINTSKSKVTDLAFTIRADEYEKLHDVATLDHTVGLMKSVSQLSQETHKLFEQQHFAVAREESQRDAIRRVHSNMVTWSFAQAIFLTALAAGQVLYLRRQFQGPKPLL